MTSSSATIAQEGRTIPPPFYERVEAKARDLWNLLDSKPDLAGAWKQLFAQVQNPRYVLSELLQNADDAGAKWASARIEDGHFIFEHNGQDFNEENFASLCGFGFSNKRNLHTIGFRGIGFKSTFSLGDPVYVTSPTLSIHYLRSRFTQPVWTSNGPHSEVTQIRVPIKDTVRETKLRENFKEWIESPASLLFFRNISQLKIERQELHKKKVADGPVPESDWYVLGGASEHRVLLVLSEEESFPADAIAEIKQERLTEDDFHLPPCRVELVLGLSGEQRLFVVLPTAVRPRLPFSCNAPFVQDPSRTSIKEPSISPTNSWLLGRLGKLAASTMHKWLERNSPDLHEAAKAYELLPEPVRKPGELNVDCAMQICAKFASTISDRHILLCTGGVLRESSDCISPPWPLYEVWLPDQLVRVFGSEGQTVLAAEVSPHARKVLSDWGWLSLLDKDAVIARLTSGENPTKPVSWDAVANLWAYVEASVQNDWGGEKRRSIQIVPAQGHDSLLSATKLIRLGAGKNLSRPDDLGFIADLVISADSKWFEFLNEQKPNATAGRSPQERRIAGAKALLDAIGLNDATSWEKVVAEAAKKLFSQNDVSIADAVRLAQIAAALGCSVGPGFKYLSRSGSVEDAANGVILDVNGAAEALLPTEWAQTHLLHDQYFAEFKSCKRDQWNEWATSEKSQLRGFAGINLTKTQASRSSLEQFLASRGVTKPSRYPYVSFQFNIADYDFDLCLVEPWEVSAKSDPNLWAKLLTLIANDPRRDWSLKQEAHVEQPGYSRTQRVQCATIPAAWVFRFRQNKCVPDTYGNAREPAELLMRTPDTEPLLHVEPFVAAELDTEATRPLLALLGVRDTPAGPDKLLGRLRDLSTVKKPPVGEVIKWYTALDRLVGRTTPENLQAICDALAAERLVLTSDGEWSKLGEVFRTTGDDELPGIAILHPDAADLPIWSRLNMEERPTPGLIVDWVKKLPRGSVIDPQDIKRLRSFLPRYAVRIWSECGHWIALDGTWARLDEFTYRVLRKTGERLDHLFPVIKAKTADLRMVRADAGELGRDLLRDLFSELEYRLNDARVDPAAGEKRDWLLAFGQTLLRVRITDPDQAQRMRAAAERLSRTVWQQFNDLEVTPYLDSVPAGEAKSTDALWHEHCLLVRHASPAKYTEPIIKELSRILGAEQFGDAVRTCIDRSPAYVEDYLAENFDLMPLNEVPRPEPPQPSPAAKSGDDDSTDASASTDIPDHDDEVTQVDDAADHTAPQPPEPPRNSPEKPKSSTDPSAGNADRITLHHSFAGSRSDTKPRISGPDREQRQSPQKQPGEPKFITIYAGQKNFAWNDDENCYIRKDGCRIVPATGPFHWEWRDTMGRVARRIWTAEQSFFQGGVEIDTDVWVLIQKRPEISAMLLVGEDGRPKLYSGEELAKMVQQNAIKVYSATYRIRKPL